MLQQQQKSISPSRKNVTFVNHNIISSIIFSLHIFITFMILFLRHRIFTHSNSTSQKSEINENVIIKLKFENIEIITCSELRTIPLV